MRGPLRELRDVPGLPGPDSLAARPEDRLLWLEPVTVTGRRISGHPAEGRSWETVRELGSVWFGRDASDLFG